MASNARYHSDFLLEGKLTSELYFKIAKAATAGWSNPSQIDLTSAEVEAVVYKRHDNTVKFVIPFLESIMLLKSSRFLDFGCGCGSSSLALSHFTSHVMGYEIDHSSVTAFRTRMDLLQVTNTSVIEGDPKNILQNALDHIEKVDAVLLLAVVEHLTEAEQRDYLKAFWDKMRPGQILVILETPNYLALNDSHTFGIPFAHTIPDEFYLDWVKSQNSQLRFREGILESAKNSDIGEVLINRRRLGLAFNPLILEFILEIDLNEVVIQDGFAQSMLDWFPLNSDDISVLRCFAEHELRYPIGFSRSVLSLALRKPKNRMDSSRVRIANEEHRRLILKQYGGADC